MGKNSNPAASKAWKQRFIPVSLCNFLHFTLMALQEALPVWCLMPISPCLLPVVAFSNLGHTCNITYIHICQEVSQTRPLMP